MNPDILFTPFTSPKLTLKNRVAMAPMTRQFSPDGVPDDAVLQYYKRRAENDVGLIITEGTTVNHKAASNEVRIPGFHGKALDSWHKIVETVHAAGGKIAPQLWHQGGMRRPGEGAYPEYPSATPSGLVGPGKKVYDALSNAEVDELIAAFTQAAKDSKDLGFDTLELHGAHGYLIDNFFWEGTNQREDQYGGSLVKRTRFATDIVQSIAPRSAMIIRSFCDSRSGSSKTLLRVSRRASKNLSSLLSRFPTQASTYSTAALVVSGNPNSKALTSTWLAG